MEVENHCLLCEKILTGRRDKKFCDPYCKSAYHYFKNRENSNFYRRVDQQLKTNRRVLKKFNKAGKATIRANIILEQGLDPNFFTHYWKNSKGDVYLFVYEYGFLARKENGYKKYILIRWQDYMEK